MTDEDANTAIEAWFNGTPLADLPAGLETWLRRVACAHSTILRRLEEDVARATIEVAHAHEAALEINGDTAAQLYALGLADGIGRSVSALEALRDSTAEHVRRGITC